MAQQLACDICGGEEAVQMLTNLATGDVMTLGRACLPAFYGQSVLSVMDAGEHAGPANKCQACRRVHEKMTTPVAPLADVSRETSEPDAAPPPPGDVADAP
jgi:hypothetical protein